MAGMSVTIQVEGRGSADLPVEVLDPSPAVVEGMGRAEVRFQVANPLMRAVTIPEFILEQSGISEGKANLSLLFDSVLIPAESVAQNTLIVEANSPWTEADSLSVLVRGAEA